MPLIGFREVKVGKIKKDYILQKQKWGEINIFLNNFMLVQVSINRINVIDYNIQNQGNFFGYFYKIMIYDLFIYSFLLRTKQNSSRQNLSKYFNKIKKIINNYRTLLCVQKIYTQNRHNNKVGGVLHYFIFWDPSQYEISVGFLYIWKNSDASINMSPGSHFLSGANSPLLVNLGI